MIFSSQHDISSFYLFSYFWGVAGGKGQKKSGVNRGGPWFTPLGIVLSGLNGRYPTTKHLYHPLMGWQIG